MAANPNSASIRRVQVNNIGDSNVDMLVSKLDDAHLSGADRKQVLDQIHNAVSQNRATVIERERSDNGRETTVDASNFTMDLTLGNLELRYGDFITAETSDILLAEILDLTHNTEYFVLNQKTGKKECVFISSNNGKTKCVAYEGAKYYSNLNDKWKNNNQYWDYATAYPVPHVLFLWWCAAKDPLITTSTPESRKLAFCRALEEAYRAHNRDNALDIDDRNLVTRPACALGFKNKFAECFKEILNAYHPDNVYVVDMSDYFKRITREAFCAVLRDIKDRKAIQEAWEVSIDELSDQQKKLIDDLEASVEKQIIQNLAIQGISENTKDHWPKIYRWIRDLVITLPYQAYPSDAEIEGRYDLKESGDSGKSRKQEHRKLIFLIHNLCFAKNSPSIGKKAKQIALMIAANAIVLNQSYFLDEMPSGAQQNYKQYSFAKEVLEIIDYILKNWSDEDYAKGLKYLKNFLDHPRQKQKYMYVFKNSDALSLEESLFLEQFVTPNNKHIITDQYQSITTNKKDLKIWRNIFVNALDYPKELNRLIIEDNKTRQEAKIRKDTMLAARLQAEEQARVAAERAAALAAKNLELQRQANFEISRKAWDAIHPYMDFLYMYKSKTQDDQYDLLMRAVHSDVYFDKRPDNGHDFLVFLRGHLFFMLETLYMLRDQTAVLEKFFGLVAHVLQETSPAMDPTNSGPVNTGSLPHTHSSLEVKKKQESVQIVWTEQLSRIYAFLECYGIILNEKIKIPPFDANKSKNISEQDRAMVKKFITVFNESSMTQLLIVKYVNLANQVDAHKHTNLIDKIVQFLIRNLAGYKRFIFSLLRSYDMKSIINLFKQKLIPTEIEEWFVEILFNPPGYDTTPEIAHSSNIWIEHLFKDRITAEILLKHGIFIDSVLLASLLKSNKPEAKAYLKMALPFMNDIEKANIMNECFFDSEVVELMLLNINNINQAILSMPEQELLNLPCILKNAQFHRYFNSPAIERLFTIAINKEDADLIIKLFELKSPANGFEKILLKCFSSSHPDCNIEHYKNAKSKILTKLFKNKVIAEFLALNNIYMDNVAFADLLKTNKSDAMNYLSIALSYMNNVEKQHILQVCYIDYNAMILVLEHIDNVETAIRQIPQDYFLRHLPHLLAHPLFLHHFNQTDVLHQMKNCLIQSFTKPFLPAFQAGQDAMSVKSNLQTASTPNGIGPP